MGEKKEKKEKKRDAEAAEVDDKAAKKAKKEEKRKKAAAAEAEAAEAPAAEVKKDKKDKKKGEEDEDKAAKKAAKKAKREAAEAAEAAEAPSAKKAKTDDDEKLSKEEKKAKKKAKAEAEAKEEVAAAAAPPTPTAAPAGDGELNRVFVGNLPFSAHNEVEWMKDTFKSAGEVTNIDWLSHADTGRFKGAAFFTFASAADASAAVAAFNGKDLEGRPMKVEIAMPKKAAPPGGFAGSGDPGEPSESVFVGNLSWSITEEALKEAFGACGEIARIKWLEKDGEFKGIAFVDFYDVDSATKAVALAGTDVCGRPLRINFSKKKEPAAGGDKWGSGGGGKGAGGGKGGGRVERAYKPAGPKPDGCTELFCGNLPWSVDEEKITAFFAGCGAKVSGVRWLNDKETGEFKGVGFVAFEATEDVDKGVSLGGENLEGRPIRLDYAGQKPKKEGAWQGGW